MAPGTLNSVKKQAGLQETADLWEMTPTSIRPTTLKQTPHFRLLQEFFSDPKSFLEFALAD